MHAQTWGFDAFFPNDSIAWVDPNSLLPIGLGVVANARMLDRREIELQLRTPLPTSLQIGDCIENITWTPEVIIRHCRFEHTNTRGILVTTRRKVLIEDNTFFRVGMHAILIADDARNWFESGPVTDVTIRGNHFIDCGYNSAPDNYVIAIAPENRKVEPGAFVHRNIRIEDNEFKTSSSLLLSARSVDGLTFIHNRLVHSDFLPQDSARSPFRITDCRNVVLEKP
jgi:hypothetical protein